MRRYQFLAKQITLNDYRVGAELGVQDGKTFKHLVENCPDLFLHGVDIFAHKSARIIENVDVSSLKIPDRNLSVMKFAEEYSSRCKLHRGLTSTEHTHFEDGELDFVFIDASHQHDDVVNDWTLWEPKVRTGGMVAGHDINQFQVKMALAKLGVNYKEGPDNVWYYIK